MNENVIPGSDIATVSVPFKRPELNTGEFYESKVQDEKIWKFPEWDAVQKGPSIEHIYSKRLLMEATSQLNLKREEYVKHSEKYDQKWKELAEKEESLRNTFISFNRFIKENREKKERAQRILEEEEKIHKRRDKEIGNIKYNMKKMKIVKNRLLINNNKLKIYEDYLSNVTEISMDFKNITNILNRYDALNTARKDLVERQKQGLEEMERKRFNMVKLCEDQTGILLGLNNILAELRKRHQKVMNKNRYWENIVYRVKSKTAAELLKVYQIRDSIFSLYHQMCLRKGDPIEYKKNDIEEILMYIKNTLLEYNRINRLASKKSVGDSFASNTSKTSSTPGNKQPNSLK